jgi:Putative peptidoglycan-binding domain-containing protein
MHRPHFHRHAHSIGILLVVGSILLTPRIAAASSAVYNYAKVKPAIDASATQRVDWVGVGDSNQIKDGGGWDDGFQYALAQRANMYATGLISTNENNADGAGTGYTYNFNAAQPVLGAITGAPSALDDYLNTGAGLLMPHNYAYLSTGTFGSGNNSGMISSSNGILGNSGPIRYDVYYGTFDSGSGQFELAARLSASPYTQVVTSGIKSTNTGAIGMATASITIPAGTFTDAQPIGFKLTSNANGITGPFFSLWQRAQRTDRLTGWSYHTLDYHGGGSLRTLAYDLQQASNTTLSYYFAQVRSLQGSDKKIIIEVNSGVNDRNDTNPSVGTNPTNTSTAAGYADNLQAFIDRIKYIWTLNGWSTSELYFVVIPSHAVAYPEDAKLVAYRQAANTVSDNNDRVAVVDFSQLCDGNCMVSNNYYINSGDHYHLNLAGYEALSTLAVNALVTDTTAPSVSITAPAPGASVSGDVVPLSATASDDVSLSSIQFRLDNMDICASGLTSPYSTTWDSRTATDGSHTLSAVAADSSGNLATSSVSLVVDNHPPIVTLNGSSSISLHVGDTYSDLGAEAADTVDGADVVVVGGDTVNTSVPGVYHVTYDAVDAANNHATQVVRTVTVSDASGPVFSSVPSAITMTATSTDGVLVTYGVPRANDAVDGSTSVSCVPASGSTFPVGTTLVTCRSTDLSNNTTYASFSVTISPQPIAVITPSAGAIAMPSGGFSSTPNPLPGATYEKPVTLGPPVLAGENLQPPPPLEQHTSTNAQLTAGVQLHDRGVQVQALQQFLISQGLLASGNDSGYFGLVTYAALVQYQKQNGLPATGYVGALTLSSMQKGVSSTGITSATQSNDFAISTSTSFNRDLWVGEYGEDVVALQKLLNGAGFTVSKAGNGAPGNESPYFGSSTRDALIRFQVYNKIDPHNGYFGAKTRAFIATST